jgi:hypothetical protein
MVRKLSLMAAVAVLLIPTSVFAARGGGGGRGSVGHVSASHVSVGHVGRVGVGHVGVGHVGVGHVGVGRVGVGHVRVSHARHFWHGRWYGYGVGPCWRLTPDGYIWICD